MKTRLTFIFLLLSGMLIAQNGINYKAVVKDDNANVVASQEIDFVFSIQFEGNSIYSELQQIVTDNNGIAIAIIGEGSPITGTFDTIDWRLKDLELNVQIDLGDGLVDFGNSEFNMVPYAIQVLNIEGLEAIDEGNGIGWRLAGNNPDYYGNIGLNAVDLSYNPVESTVKGATGAYSTAMGRNTEAIGEYSVAMGRGTEAQGNFSFAFGDESEAQGYSSIAMGVDAFATADNAIAIGNDASATNNYAVAIGRDAVASGESSFATGTDTEASGTYSTALGLNTTASEPYSTAMGNLTNASGPTATAIGKVTMASGDTSTAMGNHTVASGDISTALGLETDATGDISLATGYYTRAAAFASTTIGRYNVGSGTADSWIITDPLFEIGNGGSNATRSNALTVLKNGNVGIGTNTPQELLHISGGRLRIGTETIEDTGSNQLSIGASLIPDANNAYRLGNSSSRWIGVWATDGTINTSDRRSKTNITSLNYGLEDVLKLNPVSFNWKTNPNVDTKLGLIAQDLLKVIPEVVKTHDWETDENGTETKKELDRMGVYYSDLIPVLINAIKEQNEIIKSQKKDISELKMEVSSIKELLTELKSSSN